MRKSSEGEDGTIRPMALVLEVAWDDVAGLRHDYDTQLALGGLFVDGVDASALPPLATLELRLCAGAGEALSAPARLTVATAQSACVEIPAEARAELFAAIEARTAGVTAAACPRRAALCDAAAQQNPEPQPEDDSRGQMALDRRIALRSVAEKVQMALHGAREARQLLMRDRAGVVQSSLVRNPKTSLDELSALARAPHLAPDTAEVLTQHPAHGSSPQLALALVRNARTPLPTVLQLLPRLLPADLRSVAKGVGVRTQVAAAAKKRLLDGAK
jgi:hypothetical protein